MTPEPAPRSLVLLCGLTFSGKSTVAGALARVVDARIVSYDAINAERGLRGGEGIARDQWQRTDEEAHRRVADLLLQGGTVVVDDTSSPRLLRDRWRQKAASLGASFRLVYVDADPELVTERVRRNRAMPRRPDVADPVLAQHMATFAPPEPDEPHLIVTSGAGDPSSAVTTLLDALRG